MSNLEKGLRNVLNYHNQDTRFDLQDHVLSDYLEGCLNALEAVTTAVSPPARQRETPRQQIDRLANFIMAEVPGEPSESEGAVDCAIRIITAAPVVEQAV